MKQLLTIRNKTGSKGTIIIKNTKDFYVFLHSLWHTDSQEGTYSLPRFLK